MTELAVLVPVLNRPGNVAPLVESFLEHCPEGSVLRFICSPGDTAEQKAVAHAHIDNSQVDYRICNGGTWPHKINYGAATFPADWYLCAADDIRFTEGWWDATAALRDDPRVGVIGTNDSATGRGNPRVAAGIHTCHPLIRGSYIRDQGTIDQRGIAVHPGYAHWYVDDELVWTAKQRGAWGYCREAVIEHLHPYWRPDQVPWDATYAAGEANALADGKLFQSRAHLFDVTIQQP